MRWYYKLLVTMTSLLFTPIAASAKEPPLFDGPPLPDEELGQARGGFDLPGGITVDFGMVMTVAVDGARIVETQFAIGQNGISTTVTAAEGVQLEILKGQSPNGQPQGVSAKIPGLMIEHLIGQQVGSMVINTADNRAIDSQVDVNIRLGSVEPMALGSLPFQVENLGLEAAAWRGL